MRSELVNYIEAKNESIILLRSLVESALDMKLAHEGSGLNSLPFVDYFSEIDLNCAFNNSCLPFTEGVRAFEELYKLNLVAMMPHKNECNVYIKNVLKYSISCMEKNWDLSGPEKQGKAYAEIKALLSQIETEHTA